MGGTYQINKNRKSLGGGDSFFLESFPIGLNLKLVVRMVLFSILFSVGLVYISRVAIESLSSANLYITFSVYKKKFKSTLSWKS